ncbi:MAG: IS110 family transposase [Candidatus Helarchaeota archaeon]
MPKKNKEKKNKKFVELVQGEGRRKAGPIMGVDVHKDINYYCILNENKILDEGSILNTKDGISKLIKLCDKYHVVSTAVESTAQYHFKLMNAYMKKNMAFLVANPKQTKNTQGKKTDPIDAHRIAIAHRDGRLKPSVISPPDIMALRKGMRLLIKLVQEKTKIKQRLNQVFHQKDVDLKDLLKTKWGLNVLYGLPGKEVSHLLDEFLPKNNKRAKSYGALLDALTQFKQSLSEIERLTFGVDIARLRHLEILIKKLELVYNIQASKNPEFKRQLQTVLCITGVGPDTGSAMLAEIVDVSYFEKPSKLVKWAGLAPSVYQSGHRKKKTGKIFKAGNKYLRRAAVMVAKNIYAKGDDSNPIKNYMKSKHVSKKTYWLAICAGARKILIVVWHLLKYNEKWTPQVSNRDILEKTKKIAAKKIKTLENRLKKYKKVNERLTRESSSILSAMEVDFRPPKELLAALLQSV